jgi:F420-non-reducing hydrogenase small subunit
MRNVVPVKKLLQRVYVDGADADAGIPHDALPQLSKLSRPAQDFVKVDVCLPGCPPQNKLIAGLLNSLIEGRKPEANQKIKFG